MANELFNLNYSRLATISKSWETVGNITTQGSTLGTAGRAWSDVVDYFTGTQSTYLGYRVPQTLNGAEFRFQTTSPEDSHIVEIWGAKTDGDHLTLLVTLTLTGGLQNGDDELYFVDTIEEDNEGLFASGRAIDSGNDRIARYAVDLNGYRVLLFVATTLASSTNLRIQSSGW
jgi:hypothetical protein